MFLGNVAFVYQHLALSSVLVSQLALFFLFFNSFASSQKLSHLHWVNILSQLKVHQSPQRQSPVWASKPSAELP